MQEVMAFIFLGAIVSLFFFFRAVNEVRKIRPSEVKKLLVFPAYIFHLAEQVRGENPKIGQDVDRIKYTMILSLILLVIYLLLKNWLML